MRTTISPNRLQLERGSEIGHQVTGPNCAAQGGDSSPAPQGAEGADFTAPPPSPTAGPAERRDHVNPGKKPTQIGSPGRLRGLYLPRWGKRSRFQHVSPKGAIQPSPG